MKVVLDAMASEFGVIHTYVENLLRHWSKVHPADQLHIVVPVGSKFDTAPHERHPRTRFKPAVVTHLGADHVLDWPEGHR